MNAFAAAAAVLCADPNLGEGGLFCPAASSQRRVRAIRSRAQRAEFGGGGAGVVLTEERADISADQLAEAPRRGDEIIFDAEPEITYRVERPELDGARAMWSLVLSR